METVAERILRMEKQLKEMKLYKDTHDFHGESRYLEGYIAGLRFAVAEGFCNTLVVPQDNVGETTR